MVSEAFRVKDSNLKGRFLMRFYLSNLEYPFFRKLTPNAKEIVLRLLQMNQGNDKETIPQFDLKPTSLLTKKIAMVFYAFR
jgi:hypothetical protein